MAVHDISQMPRVLQQYADGTKIAITNMYSKVARTGLSALVNGTPVDTGRAVNNWTVTIGVPSPIYRSGGPYSSPRTVVAKGNQVIRGAAITGKNSTVFIANNAPYIQRLNDGWSKKKPAGFIERAMGDMHIVAASERILRKK